MVAGSVALQLWDGSCPEDIADQAEPLARSSQGAEHLAASTDC